MIQVARHLRAHVATTVHTGDAEKVKALGADEVIDYTCADLADVLSCYDVVLDWLGAAKDPIHVRQMILAVTGPAGFKGVGQFERRLVTDATHGALKLTASEPLLPFARTTTGRTPPGTTWHASPHDPRRESPICPFPCSIRAIVMLLRPDQVSAVHPRNHMCSPGTPAL